MLNSFNNKKSGQPSAQQLSQESMFKFVFEAYTAKDGSILLVKDTYKDFQLTKDDNLLENGWEQSDYFFSENGKEFYPLEYSSKNAENLNPYVFEMLEDQNIDALVLKSENAPRYENKDLVILKYTQKFVILSLEDYKRANQANYLNLEKYKFPNSTYSFNAEKFKLLTNKLNNLSVVMSKDRVLETIMKKEASNKAHLMVRESIARTNGYHDSTVVFGENAENSKYTTKSRATIEIKHENTTYIIPSNVLHYIDDLKELGWSWHPPKHFIDMLENRHNVLHHNIGQKQTLNIGFISKREDKIVDTHGGDNSENITETQIKKDTTGLSANTIKFLDNIIKFCLQRKNNNFTPFTFESVEINQHKSSSSSNQEDISTSIPATFRYKKNY